LLGAFARALTFHCSDWRNPSIIFEEEAPGFWPLGLSQNQRQNPGREFTRMNAKLDLMV